MCVSGGRGGGGEGGRGGRGGGGGGRGGEEGGGGGGGGREGRVGQAGILVLPAHKQPKSTGGGETSPLDPGAGVGVSGEGIKRWGIEGIRIGTSDRFGRGRGEFLPNPPKSRYNNGPTPVLGYGFTYFWGPGKPYALNLHRVSSPSPS